jgi:hypothetical protein
MLSPAENVADAEIKVLIDALSAREGGGITDLVNLLPNLKSALPHATFTVLLSSYGNPPSLMPK